MLVYFLFREIAPIFVYQKIDMKTLLSLLTVSILLTSCTKGNTSLENTELLQTEYPTVYKINDNHYICIDSIGTYHIALDSKGHFHSQIKIK